MTSFLAISAIIVAAAVAAFFCLASNPGTVEASIKDLPFTRDGSRTSRGGI